MREGKNYLGVLAAALLAACAGRGDAIDRNAPDFVRASILVASPGDDVFTAAGHLCLRLRCPTFKLDNCFSYEHEAGRTPFVATFFERLKMGLFVVPVDAYLKQFADEGRGVMEYPLELPPSAKTRLWKILDETAARGANEPYDYVNRACTIASVEFLRRAVAPAPLVIAKWPAKFALSRREIAAMAYGESPWSACVLELALGTNFDRTRTNFEKLIIPSDVIDVLSRATIGGRRVLDPAQARELVPVTHPPKGAGWFTPMVFAGMVLAVSLANWFLRLRGVDWLLLALLVPPALFLGCLYSVSHLPMTNWHWLIVPVNLLPVLCWRGRRFWALPYAATLLAWEAFVLLSPHRLMPLSFCVFAAAYLVLYLRVALTGRSGNRKSK